MATVRIPTPLRQFSNGARTVDVVGDTVAEAFEHLERQCPGIGARLVDGSGAIHDFVNVFVDGQDVRLLQGSGTAVRQESEISVIPAMAGGAARRG